MVRYEIFRDYGRDEGTQTVDQYYKFVQAVASFKKLRSRHPSFKLHLDKWSVTDEHSYQIPFTKKECLALKVAYGLLVVTN